MVAGFDYDENMEEIFSENAPPSQFRPLVEGPAAPPGSGWCYGCKEPNCLLSEDETLLLGEHNPHTAVCSCRKCHPDSVVSWDPRMPAFSPPWVRPTNQWEAYEVWLEKERAPKR